MISSIDSRDNHSTSGPWERVVQALSVALGQPKASVGPALGAWTADLERALDALGHRAVWVSGTVDEHLPLARRDLPVITRGDDGTVWLLDDRFLGWTRARRLPDPVGGRWRSARALEREIGTLARPWALVEPLLPASATSDPGRALKPSARLWRLVRTERADVGVIVLWAAVAGTFALASPIAIQVLINWLAFGGLVQPLLVLGALLLACLTLGAVASLLQRRALETLERRLFVRIVADLSARLPRARLSAFDGVNQIELANRFFDVLTLQKAASTLMLDGVGAALQFVVAIVLLGLYHPWLLFFDVLLLAGIAAVLAPFLGRAVYTAIYESKRKYQVAGFIEELAHKPIAFRLGGATALAEHRADELARHWLEARAAHFRVFFRQVMGVHALQVVASTGLLIGCGALVLNGELTLGQLVAAEFAVTTALAGLVKFTDKLGSVYDLVAGIDKLGALLDLPPEASAGAGERPTERGAHVVAREAGARDLAPVSFELRPGTRAAFIVESGTGQGTLAELITGVRAPERGVIELDGLPSDRWRPDVRYRDALLLRKEAVLNGSIRENLTLGHAATDDVLWSALSRVGLADRVHALEGGLDFEIGSQGAPLLPVELRALLVARALVRKPRLLVVDGWFDGLGEAGRARLLPIVCDASAPWTLVLLTAEPAVARSASPTSLRGAP